MKRVIFCLVLILLAENFSAVQCFALNSSKKKNSSPKNQHPPSANYHKDKIRIPAEWEEVQAVLVSWPYLDVLPGEADSEAIAQLSGELASIWAQLSAAIQQECAIWIRARAAQDTTVIKDVLARYGAPLTRYKFFVQPGKNFWVRDYGPVSFYYGDNDSLGFIDTRYTFPTPDEDDNFISILAKETGAKQVKTNLQYENGNFETDGFGNIFFTSRVLSENSFNNKWSSRATTDTMSSVFQPGGMHELLDLQCDGGTGHVDLFFKMLNEGTIALAEYPETAQTQDREILEENFQRLSKLLSAQGKQYKIHRIPFSGIENAENTPLSCEDFNADPRSYLNGLFVNKTFILPIFSDSTGGNTVQDKKVIELYSKILPGYKIVPIDSRILSLLEGGIHCVTVQIPAENPIHFQIKNSPENFIPVNYPTPLALEILNKDGIRTAVVNWRKKGDFGWFSSRLAGKDLKNFSGKIDITNYRPGDTVEYFFEAESYNGKIMHKPLTAPLGCYNFVLCAPQFAQRNFSDESSEQNFSLELSPKPAKDNTAITVQLPKEENISLTITDSSGNEVEKVVSKQPLSSGSHTFTVFLDSYASGAYMCTLSGSDQVLAVRQFCVRH